MLWKYVISDRNCVAGTTIGDFVKIVLTTGYKFFTWNGIVYVLGNSDQPFETGLLTENLQ